MSTVRLTLVGLWTPMRPSAPWWRRVWRTTGSCSLVRWTVATGTPELHPLQRATSSWRPLRRSALPSSTATSTGRQRNGQKCCFSEFILFLGASQVQTAKVVGSVFSPWSPSYHSRVSRSRRSCCCHGDLSSLQDFSYHQGSFIIDVQLLLLLFFRVTKLFF